MLPSWIPFEIVASSLCSEAGTWLEKSWNGDSATPPLARVPMQLPPLNEPDAALSTAAFTADWMPFVTLEMKYLQYCAALMHPSVSTQSMLTLPPEASACCTAFAAPRPTLPATGKMMSAPSEMKVAVIVWPLPSLVKSPLNVPFWVCSFQPSTCTWVPCLEL